MTASPTRDAPHIYRKHEGAGRGPRWPVQSFALFDGGSSTGPILRKRTAFHITMGAAMTIRRIGDFFPSLACAAGMPGGGEPAVDDLPRPGREESKVYMPRRGEARRMDQGIARLAYYSLIRVHTVSLGILIAPPGFLLGVEDLIAVRSGHSGAASHFALAWLPRPCPLRNRTAALSHRVCSMWPPF